MRAVSGYLENGRFTPYEFINLPSRIQVLLVFNDPNVAEDNNKRLDWLNEFHHMAAESANENDVFNDEAFTRRPSGRELITFSDEVDS